MKIFEITDGFKLRNPFHLLSFGLGSGFFRPAPSTWGTLFAIPLVMLVDHFVGDYYRIATLVAFLIGWLCCEVVTYELGIDDHKSIVIDEWVGFMVTMIFVPVTWFGLLYGFLAFRFFDICKPPPINVIDMRVKGGFGIMLDDVVAGMIAGGIWALIFGL